MKIAILGATSQIAKDLIVSFSEYTDYHCILFSREPDSVCSWLHAVGLEGLQQSKGYPVFSDGSYDAVINFVGVGDPARAKQTGASIFDITYQYDQLALDYVAAHPVCKYIFLSSGAVYGNVFEKPVDRESTAQININWLDSSGWYGVAKLYAESRHRALPEFSIVDMRVFNYFSHTQDISARFLITDLLKAIRDNSLFKTSPVNIVRDFLHPSDFFQLVQCILNAGEINTAVDCYTRAPIDKMTLLGAMEERYGLQYEVDSCANIVNATGLKMNYYSMNRGAEALGYKPQLSSLDGIQVELEQIFNSCKEVC